MLNGQIIQRVQSLYSKGIESDDTRLADRHIYNKLVTVRNKVLTQKKNKRQKISQWNYQVLPCIEMQLARPDECPCLPPQGCKILKSKNPIPRPLSWIDGHIIQSVTSIEGSVVYDEVSWKEKKRKEGNKYTGNDPDFFIRNEYLFITDKNAARVVTMEAIFEDFIEAQKYESICDDELGSNFDPCISMYDREFILDSSLVDTVIEMSVNELIGLFNQNQEDLTNNTRDNIIQQSK